MNDIFFLSSQQYPNVTWEEEIKLCRQTVKILNAMRPRPAFFIVCGDLVDAMPNLWPDIRREQEKDFLEIYSELDPEIPLGTCIIVFLPNGHKIIIHLRC